MGQNCTELSADEYFGSQQMDVMCHGKMWPSVPSYDLNPGLSPTSGKASGEDEVHHRKSVQTAEKQNHSSALETCDHQQQWFYVIGMDVN